MLFVSSQSEFPLRFYDENKWDSSRLPSTRYSNRDDILTRYSDLKPHLKLLGLFLLTLPPSLRSLSNLDRNVSCFASIEVTIETLRYKKKTAKTYFLAWIQINRIKRQWPLARTSRCNLMVLTSWGANCWGQNRSRRNQCLKVRKSQHNRFYENLAVKYRPNLNRTTKYRLSEGNGHLSKSAADKLEYGNQTADKPSSIDTRRPSMHTARSLRSDQARAKLGRYERPSVRLARSLRSDRARAKAHRSLRSDRARAKARSLHSDRGLVPLGRYEATGLEPKFGRCVAIEPFRTSIRHQFLHSRQNLRMLSPEDRSKLISADKYGSFEDNCEDRENGISPFLCYDGLRAEDANFGSHTGCHKSSSPHPLEDMGRKLISRVLPHAVGQNPS
ncbi:hypothetical protein IGI04_030162 [Brassica rapa subsp. trilocularis]|uniref:DUF4005 domain-containing protein n=1 Tax=Brassica rapa subsp. trilocularis TaxID=1813537 RepID=A0ABQ7LPW7_BRACM|nr:hypothetical protein IGI04_030162 [Brassica rapa subsp. trilocularis]